MALSASMAGAGGGTAMAMNPGMALGGNAMAAPQVFSSFEPPPTAGPPPGAADTGAGSGAGGAFDLRAWEKKAELDEDLHACLGVDIGTSSIKVMAAIYPRLHLICAVVGKYSDCVLKSMILLLLSWYVTRASKTAVRCLCHATCGFRHCRGRGSVQEEPDESIAFPGSCRCATTTGCMVPAWSSSSSLLAETTLFQSRVYTWLGFVVR